MKSKKEFNKQKNEVMVDCLKLFIPLFIIFLIVCYVASNDSRTSEEMLLNGSIFVAVGKKFLEIYGGGL